MNKWLANSENSCYLASRCSPLVEFAYDLSLLHGEHGVHPVLAIVESTDRLQVVGVNAVTIEASMMDDRVRRNGSNVSCVKIAMCETCSLLAGKECVAVFVGPSLPNPARSFESSLLYCVTAFRFIAFLMMVVNPAQWLSFSYSAFQVGVFGYRCLLAASTPAKTFTVYLYFVSMFCVAMAQAITKAFPFYDAKPSNRGCGAFCLLSASAHAESGRIRSRRRGRHGLVMKSIGFSQARVMSTLEHIVGKLPATAGAWLLHDPLLEGRQRTPRRARRLTLVSKSNALADFASAESV